MTVVTEDAPRRTHLEVTLTLSLGSLELEMIPLMQVVMPLNLCLHLVILKGIPSIPNKCIDSSLPALRKM